MNKKNTALVALLVTSTPALVFAKTMIACPTGRGAGSGGTTLCDLANVVVGYFNVALVVLMSFAILMFVWFVIQYYVKPNEDRKNAGQYVMYSVIGFFVILSVWGLVNILSNTFGGLDNSTNKNTLNNLPLFPTN